MSDNDRKTLFVNCQNPVVPFGATGFLNAVLRKQNGVNRLIALYLLVFGVEFVKNFR